LKDQFPTIHTESFILKQFTANDLENVFRGLSNPDVIKYYGISFNSLEETKEQLTWFADLEKHKTGIWWAIYSKDETTFYGAGGFNDLDKANQKAEIGFWLLPEHWGKGILKKVFPLLCNYGFTTLNLQRIEGFVETKNMNCKKAMAKTGFKHEGTKINCEIKNGNYISLAVYSKTNPKRPYNPQG
jgi:ribosomal-protein-alanine N-acetyltransferase